MRRRDNLRVLPHGPQDSLASQNASLLSARSCGLEVGELAFGARPVDKELWRKGLLRPLLLDHASAVRDHLCKSDHRLSGSDALGGGGEGSGQRANGSSCV